MLNNEIVLDWLLEVQIHLEWITLFWGQSWISTELLLMLTGFLVLSLVDTSTTLLLTLKLL